MCSYPKSFVKIQILAPLDITTLKHFFPNKVFLIGYFYFLSTANCSPTLQIMWLYNYHRALSSLPNTRLTVFSYSSQLVLVTSWFLYGSLEQNEREKVIIFCKKEKQHIILKLFVLCLFSSLDYKTLDNHIIYFFEAFSPVDSIEHGIQ